MEINFQLPIPRDNHQVEGMGQTVEVLSKWKAVSSKF
jgi:hypothetical protein